MCLVNALAFDAEWSATYEKYQVREGTFTKEDGTKQEADFMYGEDHTYLEDEKATGFMKSYKGGKYAFVAMLPKEGVSVSEYVASLDGTALHNLLSTPTNVKVITAIPKYETAYDVEMNDILKEMGMPTAFDADHADFSALGQSTKGNIYISMVLHKTYISVAEQGTRAGAATLVIMDAGGALLEPEEWKEVRLDRPFVYMLIDCEKNIPFFIGTMMDIER
jgi:serpin B